MLYRWKYSLFRRFFSSVPILTKFLSRLLSVQYLHDSIQDNSYACFLANMPNGDFISNVTTKSSVKSLTNRITVSLISIEAERTVPIRQEGIIAHRNFPCSRTDLLPAFKFVLLSNFCIKKYCIYLNLVE